MKTPFFIVSFFFLFFYSCTTPSVTAIREQTQGDFYNNKNVFDSAIIHYQNYLNMCPQLGSFRNYKMEADVCRKVAHAFSTQGKYNHAVEYLKGAAVLDSADNNTLEIIEDYRQLGITYAYMGQYYYAANNLQKALNLSDGMDLSLKEVNNQSIAETYLSLGRVYNILGKMEQSSNCTRQALALFTKLNDSQGLSKVYYDIAGNFLEVGNIEEGKKYLHLSLEKLSPQDDKMLQYDALATACEMEGKQEEAIKYHLEALEQAEASKITPQVVWATIRLGDAYKDLNDENKAAGYYILAGQLNAKMDSSLMQASVNYRQGKILVANEMFANSGSKSGMAVTFSRLAEACLNKGELDSALFFSKLALENYTATNNAFGSCNTKLLKANILFEKKDYKGALAQYKELSFEKYNDLRWQSLAGAGNCYQKTLKNDSAISAWETATGIIEEMWGNFTVDEFKTKFLENKFEVYDNLITLLHETGNDKKALEYSERARARVFLDMLGNRKIPAKDSVDNNLLKEEQELRLKLQKLNKSLEKPDVDGIKDHERGAGNKNFSFKSQVEKELEYVQKQYLEILQVIKLKRREYANLLDIKPSTVETLQNKLKDNEAIVSYWIGEEQILAWVIKKDRIVCKKLYVTPDKIPGLVVQSCEAIRKSRSMAENQLHQAYTILFKEIEGELGSTNTLIIIPHNKLNFLPFHALLTDENKYLIEKYDIQYAPSYSVYLNLLDNETLKGSKFLGMALGNKATGGFSPLPATEYEVNQIAGLFENKFITIADDSKEATLKRQIKDYQILHLATHGWFNTKNPMFSYILMLPSEEEDGKLTVEEIFQMDSKKKITVLSACQTGLGELSRGDELTGLSRSFLYAGSSSVIVSLWNVDDVSSALLMNRMYYYFNKGKTAVQALSAAQRDFISGRVTGFGPPEEDATGSVKTAKQSPNLWAPFVLIGNGGINNEE